jgi:hypothetical protein
MWLVDQDAGVVGALVICQHWQKVTFRRDLVLECGDSTIHDSCDIGHWTLYNAPIDVISFHWNEDSGL